MSAHKARRVINKIRLRGKAYDTRTHVVSSMLSKKLVYSAAANASHNMGFNKERSFSHYAVTKYKPRARGRSYQIQKPTCHITIVLKDISLPEYVDKDYLDL